MATRLTRSYKLTPGKSIHGMGQAIKDFFNTYSGTKVTLTNASKECCMVSCVTQNIVSAPGLDKKFWGAFRKLSGNDVKITVTLIQRSNEIEIHYLQDIDEELQLWKAVFKSFALVGAGQLYAIKMRREIPIKLNAAINDYLQS